MKINPSSKNRKRRSKGFTLVEVILVLVIAAIIAVIAVPGITRYLDNMRATRQEETVRLLYSAAQNKLTYLSANDPNGDYTEKFLPLFEADSISANGETVRGCGLGAKDADVLLGLMQKNGADYLQDGKQIPCYSAVYTGVSPDTNGAKAVRILLEESGLFNVIEKASECVIDIDPSLRFILRVTYQGVTLDFESIYNDSNVDIPESANTKPVALMLDAPLTNGEKLSVQLSCDSLSDYKDDLSLGSFKLSMTIVGQSSGETFTASLDAKNEYFDPKLTGGVYSADLTLDSLDEGFQTLFPGFIAGENIAVTLQLYYVGALPDGKPVTPSAEYTNVANNLFARADGDLTGSGSAAASISSGRHLQNLQLADSHIQSVVQSGDIDWNKTQAVYTDRKLKPISNANITSFSGVNGVQHTISDLKIEGTGNAGIFASSGADFAHLRLLDPVVSGSGNVGVLVGELTGGSISDCRAYVTDTANLSHYSVTATSGNAGGLVGTASNGAVIEHSFATLYQVSGTGNAGGLVGSFSGAGITGSYADTKTIIGQNAGGLAGSIGAGSTVGYSYAVTEVLQANAASGTAAGFAASNSGSIANSYALVGSVLTAGSTGDQYGFAPDGTAADCYYYAATNFEAVDGGAGEKQTSISKLVEEVQKKSASGKWEYDLYTADEGTNKAGDSRVRTFSHPYQHTGDYEYMADAAGTLAYPALRIAGLDHYGNWPEPAAKYTIRFVFVKSTDAAETTPLFYQKAAETEAVDTGKTVGYYQEKAEANDREDYSPEESGPIDCPEFLGDAEDKLTYTDSKGGEHRFLGWSAGEIDGTAITCPGTASEHMMELTLDQLAALADENGIVTISAIWTGQQRVNYLANLESGAAPSEAIAELPFSERYFPDQWVTISGKVKPNNLVYSYKRNGDTYLFVCWNTRADGNGTDYQIGATPFQMPNDRSIDLYAKWEKAPTLTYDANLPAGITVTTAASLPGKTAYPKEKPVDVIASPTVKDSQFRYVTQSAVPVNMLFAGWNSNQANANAGKVEYLPGAVIPRLTGDVTLYAVWKPVYQVIYDKNAQYKVPTTGVWIEPITIKRDPPVTVLYFEDEEVTVSGTNMYYDGSETIEFAGWSKNEPHPADTAELYTAGRKFNMPAEDVTFYAVWRRILHLVEITVELDEADWADRTLILKSDTNSIPLSYSSGVYRNTEEIPAGTYSVQILTDGGTYRDTGAEQLVFVENKAADEKRTVEFYTIITRHDEHFEAADQTGSAWWTLDASKVDAAADPSVKVTKAAIYLSGSSVALSETPEDKFTLWAYTMKSGDIEEIVASTESTLTVKAGEGYKWPLDVTVKSKLTVWYIPIGLELLGGDSEPYHTNGTDMYYRYSEVKPEGGISAQFIASDGYTLPDGGSAIVVKRSGLVLSEDTDYIWTLSTESIDGVETDVGTLTILKDTVKDNITVRISGVPDVYNIYFDAYQTIDNGEKRFVDEDDYYYKLDANENPILNCVDAPDDIVKDYEDVDAEYKVEVRYATELAEDTVVNGSADGNRHCTIDKPGYITIMPDAYYQLPRENQLKLYVYSEKGKNMGIQPLSLRDEEFSYSSEGVITLNAGKVPGKYVVIEAECDPAEYSLELQLRGADAVNEDGTAFEPTDDYTHFNAEDITFTIRPWSGEKGDYKLPQSIFVRMGGKLATSEQYSYDRTTGVVTIYGHRYGVDESGITGDISVSAVCEEAESTITVYVYQDGIGWADREVRLLAKAAGNGAAYSADPGFKAPITNERAEKGTYIFSVRDDEYHNNQAVYDIYVRDANGIYRKTGKIVEKTKGEAGHESVYFYSLNVKAGAGIASVSIDVPAGAVAFDQASGSRTFLAGTENIGIRAVMEASENGHTEFGGWYRSSDGYPYLEGAETITHTFPVLNFHLDLTANIAYDQLTIIYKDYVSSGRGRTFSGILPEDAPTMHIFGRETILAEPRSREPGYEFVKWHVMGSDGNDHANKNLSLDDDVFQIKANCESKAVTVFAEWKATEYTIKLLSDVELTKNTDTYSVLSGYTLPEVPERKNPSEDQVAVGYVVVEADEAVWEQYQDGVLKPGTDLTDVYGNVTLKVLWGYVRDLELTVKKDNEAWTKHPLTIELKNSTAEGDFSFTLTNVKDYGDYKLTYVSYCDDIITGTYEVYADGYKLEGKLIEVLEDEALTKDELNLYTVTYSAPEATEGTVPVDDGLYLGELYGGEAVVMGNVGGLRNTANKDNPYLIGWTDGSKTYSFGDTIKIGYSEVRLSAVWGKNPPDEHYLLTYLSNGVDGVRVPAPESFNKDGSGTAEIKAPANNSGYLFQGWTTSADGKGQKYAIGSTVPMSNDLTLYAQWGYTLCYQLEDGGETEAKAELKLDDPYVLSRPADTGTKKFVGWALESDPETVAYQAGDTVSRLPAKDGKAVLVAVWTERPITIKYETDNNPNYATQTITFGKTVILRDETPGENSSKQAFGWWEDAEHNRYYPGDEAVFYSGYSTVIGDTITLKAVYVKDNVYWVENKTWYNTLGAANSAVGTKTSPQNLEFYGDTVEKTGKDSGGKTITESYEVKTNLCIISVGDHTAQWGKTVGTNGSGNSFLTVSNGKTLTLGQNSSNEAMHGTLTFDAMKQGRIVELSSGTNTLNMYDGVTLYRGTLSNGTSTSYNGAGVDVRANAKFYMYGGTIMDCVTNGGNGDGSGGGGGGGGVFLFQNAFMQMGSQIVLTNGQNDGTEYPYSNTKTYYVLRDGFYVKAEDVSPEDYYNGTYAIVTGTPQILNCKALGDGSETNGGGGDGGGINCANMGEDKLLLYSGVISGNEAKVKGGGIRTDADNGGGNGGADIHLRIYEIEISNNKASFGGGIFQWQGTLSIMNSEISGNVADGNGGANQKDYDKHDKSNKGGGIFIDCYKSGERSSLEFYNGSIHDNKAAGDGGGIYMDGGAGIQMGSNDNGYTELVIHDGNVYNNEAGTGGTGNGGGIFLYKYNGSCTINGVNIFGNTANNHGKANDIYFDNSATNPSHAPYLVSSNTGLYGKLNYSEAAKGKQIILEFSDGLKENKEILRYETITYGAKSTTQTKTAVSVDENTQWKDADYFTVGGTWAIKPGTKDGAFSRLVLGSGYTLHYDPKGAAAEGLPEDRYYAGGALVTMTDVVPSKDYTRFDGWSWKGVTLQDQNGKNLPQPIPGVTESGATVFRMPNSDLTLEAAFTGGWGVDYLANADGEEVRNIPTERSYHEDDEAVNIIFEPTPSRPGYRFVGWDEDPNANPANVDYPNDGKAHSVMTKDGTSVELYAIWARAVSLNYNKNCGSDTVENWSTWTSDSTRYSIGDTVTPRFRDPNGKTPMRSGYKFLGWSWDASDKEPLFTEGGSAFAANESNMTLYAIWSPGYKVWYYSNDGQKIDGRDAEAAFDQSGTGYAEGDMVTVVEKLSSEFTPLEGQVFLGWNPEKNAMQPMFAAGVEGQAFQIGASDYRLYAVWQQLVKVTYVEKWDDTAENQIGYVVPGGAADLSVQPNIRDGFIGWTDHEPATVSGVPVLDGLLVEADTELYPVYSPDVCQIKLDMNYEGASPRIRKILVLKDGTSTLPVPTREEYIFAGWYQDAACTQPYTTGTELKDNDTLYAKWTKIFRITLDANGGTVDGAKTQVVEVEIGQDYTDLPNEDNMLRKGYRFDGWLDEGGDPVSSVNNVQDHMTLRAKWVQVFTVTFDATKDGRMDDGERYLRVTVDYGASCALPDAPERSGLYVEDGWYENGMRISAVENVRSNRTIVYQWQTFTLTLESEELSPQIFTKMQMIPKTGLTGYKVPVRTGKVLTGWFDGNERVLDAEGKPVTNSALYLDDNLTLKAGWLDCYDLKLMDGTQEYWHCAQVTTVTTADGINAYETYSGIPDKTNAEFVGWFEGNTQRLDANGKPVSDWTLNGNTTLKAKWKLTLTLNDRGMTESYLVNSTDSSIGDYRKPDYTSHALVGWYDQENGAGDLYVDENGAIVKEPTDSMELYAYWIKGYKLKLMNGTNDAHPQEFTGILTITELPDNYTEPTGGNGLFAGWYDGVNGTGNQYVYSSGKIVGGTLTLDHDLTLYASWKRGIKLISNDADNVPEQFYASNNQINSGVTLQGITIPVRSDGYVFAGWYSGNTQYIDAAGKTKQKIECNKNNFTLYARWTRTLTRYELTNSVSDNSQYLIVSSNAAGTASALTKSLGVTEVTIRKDGDKWLIDSADESAVWTHNLSYIKDEDGHYLSRSNNALAKENDYYWNASTWSYGSNRLTTSSGTFNKTYYYVWFDGGAFKLSKDTAKNVYLYQKKTTEETYTETAS